MKTINAVPMFIRIGCALGFIGGLVSMVCLALFFQESNSALAEMGAYMLIAVMFFGLAGGLTKTGPWNWNALLLMTFLTISAVGCSAVFGIVDIYSAVILVLIGALIVVILSAPSSRTWGNMIRV